MGSITQRGALEKKAIVWATHGFKQIKHLLASDGKTFLKADAFIKMQNPPRIPKPIMALQNAILQIPACLQETINRGPRPKDLVWATDKDDHLVKVLHTSQDVSRALCQKYTVHPRTSAADPDHRQRPVYLPGCYIYRYDTGMGMIFDYKFSGMV